MRSRLRAVTVQGRIHLLGHRSGVERKSKKLRKFLDYFLRFIQHVVIADFERADIGLGLKPGIDFAQVFPEGIDNCAGVGPWFVSSASAHHGFLRSQDFGKWPLHENYLIVMIGGQGKQQAGNNFHHLAFSFGDATGIGGKRFDALPFQITARVIGVGLTFAVGESGHASGDQHLHHERSAGARES